jgi:hypothetical protein
MEAAEVAGLEAAVVVVLVVVAGLEAVVGALGATDDVCASATEASAHTAINDVSRVVGLMVGRIVLRPVATRQAPCIRKGATFILFWQS